MKQMLLFFLLLASGMMNAQVNLSGIVRDAESGDELVGASVIIGENGTATNENGFFILKNIKKGAVALELRYVGYDTLVKEIIISENTEMNLSLYKKEILSEQIVITASRNEQMIGEVAGRVALISNRNIKATPTNSVDDLFKSTSGVFVDRTSGLIGHSVVVSIRGINAGEQGRVLALIDGLPINKTDGGSVNWNRIDPADVERIEIFKGPGSSVYGNNAMGGVVNIITKQLNKEGFHGIVETSFGTMNTFGQKASINGKLGDKEGLYFRLSGFNRNSNGYNTYREAYRDQFSIKSGLKEHGMNGKVGFVLNEKTNLQLNFNFFDDKRGQGTQVKEENYMKQKNNYTSFLLNTEFHGIKINFNVFYQVENYLRVLEKYKTNTAGELTSYSLIHVDADRIDYGSNINLTIPVNNNTITTGLEVKRGRIDGADVYKTSTDIVANEGNMTFLSGFIQDEIKLLENLKAFAGLRIDHVKFSDGEFNLTGATSATSFMNTFSGPLKEYDWTALTPKFSLQYRVSDNIKIYGAYSRGFRAATLDDLTRPGLIALGFKNANPELKPETIDNIEFGLNYDLNKVFYIMPSVYYMEGKNFMAYINTGSTVNISGRSKPIIIKDNITKVRFIGGDIDMKYFLSANLYAFANYTFTGTKILSFTGKSTLEGKQLTVTPKHLANLGITYLNQFLNTTANIHYQGQQFLSDDNSEYDSQGSRMIIDGNVTVDLKLWKKIFNMVNVSLEVQNLFDVQFLTTYDRISIGRLITAGISLDL